jgi:succinate dehydrogenase/fumarate reductase-like Fe-S protein
MRALLILQSVTIMLLTLSFATTVQASESSGTIDDSFKFTRVCQDEVCGTFGDVNWKPTLNADTTGAT